MIIMMPYQRYQTHDMWIFFSFFFFFILSDAKIESSNCVEKATLTESVLV